MAHVGRTALITGCSSGIGRATAVQLARAGFQVVATARTVSALGGLVEIAQREKLALQITSCDVTDDESVNAAVAFAHAHSGPVHVLVNNAGYGALGPLEAVSLEEARRQLDVNVMGAMRMVRAVVPDMRAAGYGRIINVSSIAGRMAIPLGGWYSASKFALEALSDTLRLELSPFGIQTVSIMPGPVRSEFLMNVTMADVPADMPELYRDWVNRIERRREGRRFEVTAEVVAEVILRAATVRRPRTRYLITLPARWGARIHRVVSDRLWDRIVRWFYQLKT
jgi:NAD(P)-dependent dehydrogenase (short-subunit alcohol dehydrogenase family)